MRKWQHGKATDPTPKDCLPADAPYPKLDMFIVQVLIEDHFHQGYRHAGVGHRWKHPGLAVAAPPAWGQERSTFHVLITSNNSGQLKF